VSEKNLKIIIVIFIVVFLWMFLFGRSSGPRYGDVNIQAMAATAADGLDLKAVGELVKQARDAEELEKLLNKPDSVNNLDLNEDNKVDYIHVTEYGDDRAKGFSLTVQPEPGETQEIATIDIEKEGEKAKVEVRGQEQIYGHNNYHHYSSPLTSFLLMSYLFSPHRMFFSPWRYGYYPGGYGAYRPVPAAAYRSRAGNIARSSTAQKSSASSMRNKVTSPNKGKSAGKGIRAPLKNPTRSQKSFQSRNPSRYAKSATGFGRSSTSSRRSVRSGGFGRSGGFRGGK
jgi:hypothetical protein